MKNLNSEESKTSELKDGKSSNSTALSKTT